MNFQNKIKVVILIDTWFPVIGGGQTHVFHLASELKRYCDVTVLTSDQKGKVVKAFKANFKIIHLGPKLSTNNPLRRWLFLILSFWHLLRKDYDVIHAQAFISGLPAKVVALVRNKPVVYTVHGTGLANNLIYAGLLGKLKKDFEKLLLVKIKYDAQISVSRDFLRLKNLNKPIYIPNGKTFVKADSLRKLDNSVVFVGRIHPQKGINTLLKAFTQAKKTVKSLKLTIIGSGKLNYLNKNVTKQGLLKDVELKKPIYAKKLLKVIQKHSVFILPSIYEGQPITLLEAMAVKTPIIASKVGDIPYMLKDHDSALLIKPNDWKGFSRAILEIIKNKQLARRLAENGYQIYLQHNSWQEVARKTYLVYKQVLRNENSN